MMYCEFIDISEYGENYITFTEYHDYIEPIYMDADLSGKGILWIARCTTGSTIWCIVSFSNATKSCLDKSASM